MQVKKRHSQEKFIRVFYSAKECDFYAAKNCQDANIILRAWMHGTGTKMLIVDLRQGMFDPLGYPLLLQKLGDGFIFDIIQGKKIVKMVIDVEAWMSTFESEKIKWRWMSEKETARVNSK